MADDCSAGFAILPIIMIFVFISILSRALKGTSRMGGGYSSYGGGRYRTYGSGFYAMQYLASQGSNRPYQSSGYYGYNPPYTPPSAYRTQPYAPSYGQPAYGQPAYGQPAYGQPAYAQPQSYPQSQSYPGAQPSYPTSSSGQYGPAFSSAPAPAYPSGQPSGYTPSAPVPEAPKVSCNYCGSLNPGTEKNCLLCGAPIK
jgi:hypothetical protein